MAEHCYEGVDTVLLFLLPSSLQLQVPEFECPFVAVPQPPILSASDDEYLAIASFFHNVMLLAARVLSQSSTQVSTQSLYGKFLLS